jgi:hypothetical protein
MTVKEFSWWTFYVLFFLIVLFLLLLTVRGFIGGALERVSNTGELIYFIGLVIAVFGLMGMCIAYILRVMWRRLRGDPGGETQKS